MRYRTTFIGNLALFLDTIADRSALHLVVAEPVRGKRKSLFGSAIAFAKQRNIQALSPEEYLGNPVPTDLIIVAGYRKLIPLHVIKHPTVAIVNIHPSLLPAYGGRNPLNWAIMNGETATGVTIHHVNEHFDDGDVILQAGFPIIDTATFMDVHNCFVARGRELLGRMFDLIGTPAFKGKPQNRTNKTYFRPIKPTDGRISFQKTKKEVRDLVRAFAEPYSGAYFYFRGEKVTVDDVREVVVCPERSDGRGHCFVWHGHLLLQLANGCLEVTKVRHPSRGVALLMNE